MQLKRSKRPVWEYVVVTAVVALAMGMALALTARRDRLFKEKLLILELQTLRNLSAAYILEHRAVPKTMKAVSSSYFPTVDPFGSPYQFHSENAWIASTTPRYRHW